MHWKRDRIPTHSFSNTGCTGKSETNRTPDDLARWIWAQAWTEHFLISADDLFVAVFTQRWAWSCTWIPLPRMDTVSMSLLYIGSWKCVYVCLHVCMNVCMYQSEYALQIYTVYIYIHISLSACCRGAGWPTVGALLGSRWPTPFHTTSPLKSTILKCSPFPTSL